MDDSEDNMSAEDVKYVDSPSFGKGKSKKRSLVERELETSLTARVTSPITNGEASSTSRYGRARKCKTDTDSEKVIKIIKSPKLEKSPIKIQSPVYKMHASNSPIRLETPKRVSFVLDKLENQIENIYNENIALSRFGFEEKNNVSPPKKIPKLYIRKDLIQQKDVDNEEAVTLINNIFSPVKLTKSTNTHLNNVLERSSEKYSIKPNQNGYLDTSSVVKTLDFDSNKKKKKNSKDGKVVSQSDIFEIEAKCEYQVGDLAWARMGTYPFWPCIITRDPQSGTFVKKKLCGRFERDILHVTFFGDNGRRGWIVDSMLRRFLGQLEFETTRERFSPERKKRDSRLYAAFFISEKKLPQWNLAVEEAETLMREPKRLRIDILYDLLEKSQSSKGTPKLEKSRKVMRTDSDVSLSESLYDTLFSEDDNKNNDYERSKSKTRNKSLDVSEVVTACLDNMAAKTGITKIQRQSHMDRWLQKAKSKTPEKSNFKKQVVFKKTKKDKHLNHTRKIRPISKGIQPKLSYTLKRSSSEYQGEAENKLSSHQNEHDYSKQIFHNDTVKTPNMNKMTNDQLESGTGITAKVESFIGKEEEDYSSDHQSDLVLTFVDEEFLVMESDNGVKEDCMKNNSLNLNEIDCKHLNNAQATNDMDCSKTVQKSNSEQVSNMFKVSNMKSLSKSVLNSPKNLNIKTKNCIQSVEELTNINQNVSDDLSCAKPKLSESRNLKETKLKKKPIDPSIISNHYNIDELSETDKITESIFMSQNNNQQDQEMQNISANDSNGDQIIEINKTHNNKIKTVEQIKEKNDVSISNIATKKIEHNMNKDDVKNKVQMDDIIVIPMTVVHNVVVEEHVCDKENVNVVPSIEADDTISIPQNNILAKSKLCDISTKCENHSINVQNVNAEFNEVENNCKEIESSEISLLLHNDMTSIDINQHISEGNKPIITDECKVIINDFHNVEEEENLTEQVFVEGIIREYDHINTETSEFKIVENHDSNQNEVKYMHGEGQCSNLSNNLLINNSEIKIFNDEQSISNDNIDIKSKKLCKNIDENYICNQNEEITMDGEEQCSNLPNKLLINNSEIINAEENINYNNIELNSNNVDICTRQNDNDLDKKDQIVECLLYDKIEAAPDVNRLKDNSDSSISDEDVNTVTENADADSNTNFSSCNDQQSGYDSDTNMYNSKDNIKHEVISEKKVMFKEECSSSNLEECAVTVSRSSERKLCSKMENLESPEFLKYLEMRQDSVIDENPHLTQEEIVHYLYKTWLYEESVKSDRQKIDDLEQASLVKGLNQDSIQPKKIRKKVKAQARVQEGNEEFMPKTKSKRKIVRPFYSEDLSDFENEIEFLDMFPVPGKVDLEVENNHDNEQIVEDNDAEHLSSKEFDLVEEYFAQLTRKKPNLFKGLIRESVCEICETIGNLVKCKGCNSKFHVECTKKVVKVVAIPTPSKGRKKRKKNRGRKKNSEDSNGLDLDSQSDEKSQDVNVSGDNVNLSVEDESEAHITVEADVFDAQFSAKMQQMFDEMGNIQYGSDSSDAELDWSDTEVGKCKIVDVKIQSKEQSADMGYSDFKCNNCKENDIPVCFVCKSATSPRDKIEYRQRCQVPHCNRYYHLECLEHWPQTQFSSGEPSRNNKKIDGYFESLTCPLHVCHTCVCDDPRGCKTRFSGDKLARCVRCPATYHSFTKCLPAGSQILTGSHIICPRHYKHRPGKVPCHVNTGWCFICALGGSLICCEYCPTSFHAECLNIKPPEGGYMCEDCETGRLPLYGEMVWVKLGHYRWWPGIILHPSEIPLNLLSVKHSPGEFVVRFFGQYDHYWVNRGRVFPFQEGDSGKVSSQKSKIDAAFSMAMEHAQRACAILKDVKQNEEESLDIASSFLPPHYVKLKVNKPCGSLCGRRIDMEESSLTQCECNPDEEEPCGAYSHCLNRMLLTECGPTCRAGDRCQNRAFEKRLYPKLVPYRTPHRGWGLKTLEDIKAGQFVIEYVGELIDEEEFKRRMTRKHEIRDENYYFLTLDKERMIDAGPKGNLARFMNHCCEPNCETQKWTVLGDVRVGLFALRNIPANSEVTFNYNLQCAGIEKKRCLCGAKRCSGYIGAKPKQEDPQPKKNRKEISTKRPYKKRKNIEISPTAVRSKPVKSRTPRSKPKELTEIEKDLLIIKNATNGMSSDSDCSGRLSSVDGNKESRQLKRRRVAFSTEEITYCNGINSPSTKRIKMEDRVTEVGD